MTSFPLLRLESHIVPLGAEASVTITRVEVRRDSSAHDETAGTEDVFDAGDSNDGSENSDVDEDCDVNAAVLEQLSINCTWRGRAE